MSNCKKIIKEKKSLFLSQRIIKKQIYKPGSVPLTNTLVEVSIIYLGEELPPRSNNLPSKFGRATLKPWFI